MTRRNVAGLAVGLSIGAAMVAWQASFAPRPTSRPAAVVERNLGNMRRIMAAIELYRADRGDAYPDSLDALFRFADFLSADDVREMTTDPATGLRPGYLYVKPAGGGADPGRTPVLWERKGDGAIGYADGHVEPAGPRR